MKIWLISIFVGASISALLFFYLNEKDKSKYKGPYTVVLKIGVTPDIGGKKTSSPDLHKFLARRTEEITEDYELTETGNLIELRLFHIIDTSFDWALLTKNKKVEFREVYHVGEITPMIKKMQDTLDLLFKTDEIHPPKKDSMSKAVSDLLDSMSLNESKEESDPKLIINNNYKYGEDTVSYQGEVGTVILWDTALIRSLFESANIKSSGPSDGILYFGNDPIRTEADKLTRIKFYFLKSNKEPGKTIIENEDIADALSEYDKEGKVTVILNFDSIGSLKWAKMTRDNLHRPIAIVLDERVVSCPTVSTPIIDGSAVITGNYTTQDGIELSNLLKSSKLPVELHLVSVTCSSELKKQKQNTKFLIPLTLFVFFSGLAFYIFKTLKVR